MATELIMPKNGMEMTEGTLIRWLKSVGDRVERDEPIMEIETDKVSMEVESPAAGTILAQYFEAGAVVPVLTVMGFLGEPGEAVPNPPQGDAQIYRTPRPGGYAATPYARAIALKRGISLSSVVPTGPHGEIKFRDIEARRIIRATPLAASMAVDLGVELSAVSGSGVGGKITCKDVMGARCPTEELKRTPMSNMRRTIARRMSQSHAEIPAVTQNVEVDVTALLTLRARLNARRKAQERVTINDFVLRATAIALGEEERLRTRIEEGYFVTTNLVNIGVAVEVPEGLLVPVVRFADRKDLFQLSAEMKRLSVKAREGNLTVTELGGGSITVSNVGMYGIHSFTPIINQPEASILGVCALFPRLVLADGAPVERQLLTLCHTYDHRIMNGAEAARFELRVQFLLEHPSQLLGAAIEEETP